MERTAYRIVDANFNRAREAIRVIEEYCRFGLDSAALSARARRLRHELTIAIGRLDAGRLICSRDTLGDVGVGRTVDKKLERNELRDCFAAACKRLTEALRALAEVTRTGSLSVAEAIEALRYDAYTLEKDIVVFGEPAQKFARVKLYVIITSNLPAEIISLANKCSSADADCIQLRAKDIKDDTFLAVASEFVQICEAAGVLSIINDRVDVAAAAGADGVHLGQNDLPVEQARRLQLTPLIIGKSTHSLEQLRSACAERPTYVSLGPVFTTETKPGAAPVGLDYVTKAVEELAHTGIGHVAIGGITPDNINQVVKAGAKTIAVCSAVTGARDPAAVCRALGERIAALSKE
ncbi:MAG: thiamine phosphate synthase [Phycisphaerales bacterium]|nr:MAG: thiamine phosphate synthase [Phycisphaerales bacterium]